MRDGPNSPPLMARGEHPVVPPSARGTLTFQGRRRSQNRADQRTNALTFVPPGQLDALVARYRDEIAPQLPGAPERLDAWFAPSSEHGVPARFAGALDAIRGA